MSRSRDAVIALESVAFSYGDTGEVLSGISLEVSKGERVAVLGHNGSGKSTLVKIMGALQIPTQGACFVCGYDTSDGASLPEIHRRVSLVFQNPESQIVGAVVEDDAAFAPENQGIDPREIERRISWALEKVGLAHKRGALSSALSGGEKQRLALAGALAADAVCLVLDEPTAMLDPEGRAEVENVLRDIHASGTTIVQVTHRMEDVLQADRALVLSRGRWLWQGRREDFWKDAESLGFSLPPLLTLRRRLARVARAGGPGPVMGMVEAAESALPLVGDNVSLSRPAGGRIHLPPPDPLTSPGPAALAVGELCYSFDLSTPLETQVLKEVSCCIPQGSWVSVLGRTGSGKSTLIQHLNGLYKIQKGEILMDGKPLPQEGPAVRLLRRRVGLVFQTPEDQFFSPTVREELAFAPRNWGFSPEETDSAVEDALRSVGLGEEYFGRNPLSLSGGERRLVAIASVLSAGPECLVLDEPTAGLDIRYRGEVVALLSRLRAEGRTVVTVTHDFEMAFEHSDRLIVMSDGSKLCEGPVREVLPVLLREQRAFMPEILQVSDILREKGLDVPLTWDVDTLCRALFPTPQE
ncbi:MAG: ATP-binding cassette domain-containing protein [Synergistaceae bacterium]|nr:ATP-binding cassette domain-containing protein [Synergistaceae bacterium]